MTQEEYIKQLGNTVESLTSQIENLTETVNYLTNVDFQAVLTHFFENLRLNQTQVL